MNIILLFKYFVGGNLLRVILVGGGTAGHINPALALAEYIKKQDINNKILYIGAKNNMEENLVKQAGFDFRGITISGFSRKLSLDSVKKNLITFKNLIISSFESRKILKEFNPDICIGTGGYVCGPFLMQAHKLKIPFLIHDSNSFPGVTTKLLAKVSNQVLISNKEAEKYLPKNIKITVTGTPVREKIISYNTLNKQESRQKLGITNNLPVILSFGGSLGSSVINNLMLEIMLKNDNYNFIHGFGKKNSSFSEEIKKNCDILNNSRYIIKEYIDNMPECLAAADLVICRAGATSISEIQAAYKPAILIPSPNVAENHQFYNSLTLVKSNCASMIEEKDLNYNKLLTEINNIINTKKSEEYVNNLKKNSDININSSKKIYNIIKDILK